VSAVAFGLTSMLLLGPPALALLVAAGVTELTAGPLLTFNIGFAGAAGVVTAVVATLMGVAPERDVSDDPRWCRDPAAPVGGAVYPCEPIDKGCLLATDRARGCSNTPTWQLVVRGALDPAHVRSALADVVARYPSLTTKIQSLDGAPPGARRFRYAHDPSFQLDDIFEVVDVRRDPGRLDALIREVHNRYTDQFVDFPVTLTMAITAHDGCRLLFRQHHGIADGRAFIGLLGDFGQYLNAARAGRRPSPEALAPIGRRAELEALGLGRLRQFAWTAAGYALSVGAMVRTLRRPVVPLVQNQSNDYTGDNGTVHWSVDEAALQRWNAARKRMGVSLNSMLTAALFLANQRWHRALGQPLGLTRGSLLMETRPRDGGFVSFANHLATLEVEVMLDRDIDMAPLARTLQTQVDAQRRANTPIEHYLYQRQLVKGMTLEPLPSLVLKPSRPAPNVDFSNLIALAFPVIEGEGWAVDEVLITTPVGPRLGIVLTVIHYRERVIFNFNYKASAATRAQTEELCAHFQAVLREATGVETDAVPLRAPSAANSLLTA
jgi:hypothetical protein